ncbi:MAG: hypothetical protein EBR70_05610, partial [Verrucomicrobia bacterium]|nr:hypothetical protein [Verrucomicrobiota bacterium]
TRPTLSALKRVSAAGLMPQATADALAQAYEFLRRVEHRIQYLDDQQTHLLPTRDDDLAWLASTLGCSDACEFLARLDAHRELVAQEFDRLLGGDEACPSGNCNGPRGAAHGNGTLEELAERAGGRFGERLRVWLAQPRVLALREDARSRLARLAAFAGLATFARFARRRGRLLGAVAGKRFGEFRRVLDDADGRAGGLARRGRGAAAGRAATTELLRGQDRAGGGGGFVGGTDDGQGRKFRVGGLQLGFTDARGGGADFVGDSVRGGLVGGG